MSSLQTSHGEVPPPAARGSHARTKAQQRVQLREEPKDIVVVVTTIIMIDISGFIGIMLFVVSIGSRWHSCDNGSSVAP
jgi:hypothetical protein